MADPLQRLCVQIVSNPQSGTYSAKRLAALTAAWENAGACVIHSGSSQTVPFVLDPAATMICIAGGDGTARHVLLRLAQQSEPPPVCVYPMGTINLIARELLHPSAPDAFVAHAMHAGGLGRFLPVSLNSTGFVVCASIGPDSLSVARVSEPLKRKIGRLAYGVSLVRMLGTWPRPKLHLDWSGGTLACEAVYIAKGRYFAGPWSFAPAACLHDGRLHIIALRTARRRDYLRFMIAMMTGRVDRLDNTIGFTTDALTIKGDQHWPIQADGDDVATLPCTISVGRSGVPGNTGSTI